MQQLLLIVVLLSVTSAIKIGKVCSPTGTCGQCLSNSDCSNPTPYCDTGSMTCHACTTDAHCRSESDCNRTCTNWQCATPGTYALITCNAGEVCYERLGICLNQCTSDAFCSTIPIVLHYPNTGVCDNSSKKCFDCLVTDDCNSYRNLTCGAQCLYDSDNREYLCGNGNVCPNTASCTLVNVPNTYQCVGSSNILYISYSLLLILLFIF